MSAHRRSARLVWYARLHVHVPKLAQQQVIDAGVHADVATTAANVSACPEPWHLHSCALDPPVRPVICTAPAGTCSTKRALMWARRLHMRWYRGMPLCTRVCKSARERRNRTAIVKTAVGQHARKSGLRTPAVLTAAVPLHLSSADLPTRVHKAVTRCRRTCNRRTYMSAHLVEHVPAGGLQMTRRIGGSSMHARFAAVAILVCAAASITRQCASFVKCTCKRACQMSLALCRCAGMLPYQKMRGCRSLPLPPPLPPPAAKDAAIPTAPADVSHWGLVCFC